MHDPVHAVSLNNNVRRFKRSMSPDATKQQSETRLRALGVPINVHLPFLDPPAELSPRSARSVASRAFVLSYLVSLGFGHTGAQTLRRIQDAGLASELSPKERAFLAQPSYSQDDSSLACWFGEAVLSCAWAMRLVEFHPLLVAPDDLAGHFLAPEVRPGQQIHDATLRPFDELYSEADFHYRLHWAVRSWRSDSLPTPVPEILIRMRRHALDWIIGVPEDWDDISLDT